MGKKNRMEEQTLLKKEGVNGQEKPITNLLHDTDFDKLNGDSTLDQIEHALRQLPLKLKGVDRLQRQTLREIVIKKLKELGVTAPAQLADAVFKPVRKKDDASPESNGLNLSKTKPWANPVDGAALLDDLTATFKRFLVLPEGAAETFALWVLHTHCFEAAHYTPYLNISSPVKGCGKTTTLEILGHLVDKPLFSSNITGPAVFRTVEAYCPTLLIDEADTFLYSKNELHGVLNSGNRKGTAFVIRVVGDDYEPKSFSTWCPKVFALIGRLPETLEDRSIVVTMHRKTKEEKVEEFNPEKMASALKTLQRKCARWAEDNLDALREADPQIPRELHNRTRDKWRPLLGIAEVAGEKWPERAREIALLIGVPSEGTDKSRRVQLLADIRGLFDEKKTDCLSSGSIEWELEQMEDRPWPEYKNGRQITKRQIASLLASFGIKPKQLWLDQNKQRGYERADFEDAFSRYLPTLETVEPVGSSDGKGFSTVNDPVGDSIPTASEHNGDPHEQCVLPDLPDENGDTPCEHRKGKGIDTSQLSDTLIEGIRESYLSYRESQRRWEETGCNDG